MFDKLDDLLIRFEEVLNELGEPGVTDNQEHFQKLMKEQSDLQPIVDAYREYKKNKEECQLLHPLHFVTKCENLKNNCVHLQKTNFNAPWIHRSMPRLENSR